MKRRNALTRRRVFGSKEYKSTGRMFITALMDSASMAGFLQGKSKKAADPEVKKAYRRMTRIAMAFESWLAKHGLL